MMAIRSTLTVVILKVELTTFMAAEWQDQQMGRAWTGSGTLNNLNASLSAKRVGQVK